MVLFTPLHFLELEDEPLILQKSPSRRKLLMNTGARRGGWWERENEKKKRVLSGRGKKKRSKRAINYSEKFLKNCSILMNNFPSPFKLKTKAYSLLPSLLNIFLSLSKTIFVPPKFSHSSSLYKVNFCFHKH